MCYPWRVRLPLGWRLLMCAHPLMWSHEWFSFSGAVDANYNVIDGCNVGSFWRFDYQVDHDANYFNIEHVMAFREPDGYDSIAAGTPLFAAIPVFDPDYEPRRRS
jgi:hypothetical protein